MYHLYIYSFWKESAVRTVATVASIGTNNENDGNNVDCELVDEAKNKGIGGNREKECIETPNVMEMEIDGDGIENGKNFKIINHRVFYEDGND